MSQIGRITVRKLSELQNTTTNSTINETLVVNKNVLKNKLEEKNEHCVKNLTKNFQCRPQEKIVPKKVSVKNGKRRSWKEELSTNQTRLESYFKICPKSQWNNGLCNSSDIKRRGCIRLFTKTDKPNCETNKTMIHSSMECITISSDSEEENTKGNNAITAQNKSKTLNITKGKVKKAKKEANTKTNITHSITKAGRKLVNKTLSPLTSINHSTLNRSSQNKMTSNEGIEKVTVIEKMNETKVKTFNDLEKLNETANTNDKIVAIMNAKIPSESIEFLDGTICDDGDLNNNKDIVKNVNNKHNNKNLVSDQLSLNNPFCQNEEQNAISSTLTTIDLTLESISKTPGTISNSLTHYTKRKRKPCPPYKIIEDTTFAVDAFQFGYLENITHYFLTHFHVDHYIGLTRKFSYPIYMSELTGRLVQLFINLNKSYVRILPLNEEVRIDDTSITVTALDANHCPGAIMLLFKHLQTGKCILHTGDFRATYEMEMLPSLWNHTIHTLYLDTTYIKERHPFCTQDDSVEKAKQIIYDFQRKNQNKNILYVCGSYVIGKEKFWSALAEEFNWKVWSEENRYKALKALNNPKWNELLVSNVNEAQLHVIAMAKLNYTHLMKYFLIFENNYDMILAIRPSGWENNTKPKLSGKINIIGIEYSEHSNLHEMERFVRYLKPKQVISTVPVSRDLFKTSEIPKQWYKYTKQKPKREQQNRITNYMTSKKLNYNLNMIINGSRKATCHLNEGTVSPLFISTAKAKANILRDNQKENTLENDYVDDNDDNNDNDDEDVEEAKKQRVHVRYCIRKVENWLNQRTDETNNEIGSKDIGCIKSSDINEMDENLTEVQSDINLKKLLKRPYDRIRLLDSDGTTIINDFNTLNEAKTPKKMTMTNVTLHHHVNTEKSNNCNTPINRNKNLLKTNESCQQLQEKRFTHSDLPLP